MEEMEHSLERDKPETEITDSTIPNPGNHTPGGIGIAQKSPSTPMISL